MRMKPASPEDLKQIDWTKKTCETCKYWKLSKETCYKISSQPFHMPGCRKQPACEFYKVKRSYLKFSSTIELITPD